MDTTQSKAPLGTPMDPSPMDSDPRRQDAQGLGPPEPDKGQPLIWTRLNHPPDARLPRVGMAPPSSRPQHRCLCLRVRAPRVRLRIVFCLRPGLTQLVAGQP